MPGKGELVLQRSHSAVRTDTLFLWFTAEEELREELLFVYFKATKQSPAAAASHGNGEAAVPAPCADPGTSRPVSNFIPSLL